MNENLSNEVSVGTAESGIILNYMLQSRSILISEIISDKVARRVTELLIMMQSEDKENPIKVYINSPGGSADSGFAIYDMLKFVEIPIITICTGLCASAAVLPYLSTEKEKRYSLPHSRFLLHQPSTTVFGSASDVKINADEILKTRERFNEIVAEETGKTTEKITEDADRDFWLSPGEALEYGMVGKIISNFKEIE